MRVLFDTNVLLAAFITEGLCYKILWRAIQGQFELYLSPFIINEFKRILREKLSATNADVRSAVMLIKEISTIVHPEKNKIIVKGVCRDSDDDCILLSALSGDVDYIVSGDTDLLVIKYFKGVKIISPREFELLFP